MLEQQQQHRFLILREAGAVRRLHTARTLRQQTLAEHSWGVAMLVLELMPSARATLLHWALTHDLHELETGDTPAPTKWKHPAIEDALRAAECAWDRCYLSARHSLSTAERQVFKWADMAELVAWTREELLLGNQLIRLVYLHALWALRECPLPEECGDAARRILHGLEGLDGDTSEFYHHEYVVKGGASDDERK